MMFRGIAGFAFLCVAIVGATRSANAALDLLPAPGASPMHVRVTQASTGPDGPRTTTGDYMLRRTGPATAALQQKSDVDALAVDAEGVLHSADAGPASSAAGLDDLIDALNIAHGVLGVPGAGDKPGWSAEIAMPFHAAPLPVPSSPAPAKTPPPAPDVPPLTLPMQAVAANGGTDIDGAVETTLGGSSAFEQHRESRSRGGGSGERGASRGPNVPVILDLHVTGRIVAGSLTHLTIVQTRRVVLDGLTYTNVTNATFDVAR